MEKCLDFLIKRDELKPGDHMYLELGYHIDSWRSADLYVHHGLSSSSPSTYLEESQISSPSPPGRKQSPGKKRMEGRTPKVAISCPLPSSVSSPSPLDRKQSLGKERMEGRTLKVGSISCPLPSSVKQSPGKERMEGSTPKGAISCALPSSVSSPSPLERKQSLGKERMEGRTLKVGAISCPLPFSVKQSPGKERMEGCTPKGAISCPLTLSVSLTSPLDRKQSLGKERMEGLTIKIGAISCPLPSSVKQSPGNERMEWRKRAINCPLPSSVRKERMEGSPDRKPSPGNERMEGSPDRKQSPGNERMEKWNFFNKIKRYELKPSDHIYSWRSAYLYAHHGIYMGGGKVIHFTSADANSFSSCPSKLRNLCETCGYQSRSHGVIISCLNCFLSGEDLSLFRYSVSPFMFIACRGGTCTRAPSDPCDEVLHRARYLLDHNGFGIYNAFRKNCEDFAIYCKTGLLVEASFSIGNSGQASALMTAAGAAIAPAIAFARLRSLATANPVSIVVAGGMYCVGRYLSDIGFRPDTIKISVEDLVAKMH